MYRPNFLINVRVAVDIVGASRNEVDNMAIAKPAYQSIPFLREQFAVALGNSSVVVKFVCVAVFSCYFLSFSESALRALTVTPGNVLPPNFWIWTYFTHSFIEVHIWVVLIDVLVVVLYGKLLEPLWGAFEMLVFYLLINLSVAVFSTLSYLSIFLISRNPDYLFTTHIHGLAGYLAGFSVAVKQVMPDHVLVNSPFGKLRNRHIPLLMLLLSFIVRLIGGVEGPYPVMFGWGLLVSWTYLRFYQKHSNGNRGDMADSFTFASFFPDTFQPIVAVLSNTVFNFLVRIRLCRQPTRKYDISNPTTITVNLPGTDPQDAERRRQLALKALNERLSKVTTSDPSNWPSLEDQETPPTTPETSSTTSEKAPILEIHKLDSGKSDDKPLSPVAKKLPVPEFKENAPKSKDSGSTSAPSTT